MLISEAVKEAMETGGKIIRKTYYGIEIKPTNTPDGFIIFSKTEGKPPAKRWQPLADDLIADDWEVIDKKSVIYQKQSIEQKIPYEENKLKPLISIIASAITAIVVTIVLRLLLNW